MIQKEQIKKDIFDYLGIADNQQLQDEDLINLHGNATELDLIEMLLSIEEKYGVLRTTGDEKIVAPHKENPTLADIVNWFYFHLNQLEFKEKLDPSKQLWGIYYGSREVAREHNDPLLDVVIASSEEEAVNEAKKSKINDHGAGFFAASLSYYKEQLAGSTDGSDLKSTYSFLVREINERWKSKHSSSKQKVK